MSNAWQCVQSTGDQKKKLSYESLLSQTKLQPCEEKLPQETFVCYLSKEHSCFMYVVLISSGLVQDEVAQ